MQNKGLKKFVLSLAIVCLVFLSAALFAACSTTDIDSIPKENFMYNLNEDGTYSLGRFDGSVANVVIPETYKGKSVVKIENGAFDDCKNVLSLVIPDSVTEVEPNALIGLRNLQKLTAPAVALSSVSKIQKIDTLKAARQ